MAVVSALSACGRFSVTSAAAPLDADEDIAAPPVARVAPAGGAAQSSCHAIRLPQVVPAQPPATSGFSRRPHFRAIYDCASRANSRFRFVGASADRSGADRGANLLMIRKRLATAAAFCVLAAQAALAQKAAPCRCRPQPAAVAPAATRPAATASGRACRRTRPAAARRCSWSPQEIELAQARCTALLKGLDVVAVPETPMREGSRMRHARADEARQHRQEPAGGPVAAADRHLRHDRGAAPDGWSATCSRWRASTWARPLSASRP